MERMIRIVFVGLASVVAATGVLLGPGAIVSSAQADSINDVALKRDEDEPELLLARDDDDDDDFSAASRSRSLDRSRD
jgi:hypothetical protein